MGKRILVADDSLTIQKAFAMVLGGQDYTLLTARSVDEALVSAKGARPDLIIADAVLGSGSGYDLCASVKAEPALYGVPVHILASNQNPLDEARAHRVGADGHLLKPFDSQTLLDSVSAALVAPARPVPAPVIEVPAAAAPHAAPASPWPPIEQVEIEEEVFRAAEGVLHSAGVTHAQAITSYFWRIAHNEEPVDTSLYPDRTPMPRTIREQLYRFS